MFVYVCVPQNNSIRSICNMHTMWIDETKIVARSYRQNDKKSDQMAKQFGAHNNGMFETNKQTNEQNQKSLQTANWAYTM